MMMEIKFDNASKANALSIGQMFTGIDSNACKLLVNIANMKISQCVVNTNNGLMKVYWYAADTCNVYLNVVSNDIRLTARASLKEFENFFSPWLYPIADEFKAAEEMAKKFQEEFQSTEAWIAELRQQM